MTILAFFILTFPFANKSEGYGISGVTTFTYEEDESEGSQSITNRSSFEQSYTLNYDSFFYKPKLLNYTLTGKFVTEDAESNTTQTEIENKDYAARFNFLQESGNPVSLWTSSSTNTTLTSGVGAQALSIQTTQMYGLDGGIIRRRLPSLSYSLRQTDRDTGESDDQIGERIRDFNLTLSDRWEQTSIGLDFTYQNIFDKYTYADETTYETILSGDTFGKLSKNTDINADLSFFDNTQSETMEIKGGTTIQYVPSNRFDGSMDTRYFHLDQEAGINDSLSNSVNLLYRISDALTTSGGGSVSYNTGMNESMAESLYNGFSYFDRLSDDLNLSAGTNLSVNSQQSDASDLTTVAGGLSSNVTRLFQGIKSNLNSGVSANYSETSKGSISEGYSFNMQFNNNYITNLMFNSSVEYDLSSNTEIPTEEEGIKVRTSDSTLTSDASLSYLTFFGWRTKVILSAGATATTGESERKNFYTNGYLSYLMMRNLLFSASTKYDLETVTISDSFTYTLELNYRIRSIFITLSHDWERSTNQAEVSKTKHTFFKLTRPF